MRAISLHEPWASLIANGWKTIETRSRRTHHRGPLAIHAAKRWTPEQEKLCAEFPFSECVDVERIKANLGKVLCIVTLYNCVPAESAVTTAGSFEFSFGNYAPGRFAWLTRDLIKLKSPIPVVGRQGMFDVPLSMCGWCGGIGLVRNSGPTVGRCENCAGNGFVRIAA